MRANAAGAAAVFCVFIVYLLTLGPGVGSVDSGELAAVAHTLGIAHPTGYPLFTLLGWCVSRLPLGLRVITLLNVFSALLCSLGVFWFYRFLVLVLSSIRHAVAPTPAIRPAARERWTDITSALGGALILAFSRTYWSQALSFEVYPLHVLFLGLLLYSFTAAASRTAEEGRIVPMSLFSFLLGLSFTNHMTTLLLAPGFLYLYFASGGRIRRAREISWLAVPFALGLSAYLYLPLRALARPALNWGDPATLERMARHVGGKQYQVWIFSSAAGAGKQLERFFAELPREFAYAPIALALVGLWCLGRRHRRWLVFTGLLFITCVAYAINYNIRDIESYFLLAYAAVAVWAAVGLHEIIRRAGRRTALAAAAVLAWAAIQAGVQWRQVDRSDVHLVDDYTADMFASIEPDGIVLSYQWDFFISASYYFQAVEGVRPDVTVIDKELLRRSWYFAQLERRAPWLIERSRGEVRELLAELRKFERDEPYDAGRLESRYAAVIRSFIERNIGERPVYVTPEIEAQYTRGFRRIPAGLAFRLTVDRAPGAVAIPHYRWRPTRWPGRDRDAVMSLYGQSYANHAVYFDGVGEADSAAACLEMALAMAPDSAPGRALKENWKRLIRER